MHRIRIAENGGGDTDITSHEISIARLDRT